MGTWDPVIELLRGLTREHAVTNGEITITIYSGMREEFRNYLKELGESPISNSAGPEGGGGYWKDAYKQFTVKYSATEGIEPVWKVTFRDDESDLAKKLRGFGSR